MTLEQTIKYYEDKAKSFRRKAEERPCHINSFAQAIPMTSAESCKELHEVETERPQTIGCFNCRHETKMLCEEPCMVCNAFYSEWRQKE